MQRMPPTTFTPPSSQFNGQPGSQFDMMNARYVFCLWECLYAERVEIKQKSCNSKNFLLCEVSYNCNDGIGVPIITSENDEWGACE